MAGLSKSGITTGATLTSAMITNLYDVVLGNTAYENLSVMQNVSDVYKFLGTYDADFVFGSPQLDDDADSDHDNRFFFDKSKGAFRVGAASDDSWNEANLGLYSIGLGLNAKASSTGSIAIGFGAIASASYALALGFSAQATATNAVAIGIETISSGQAGAIALGDTTTASGHNGSLATGHDSVARLNAQHAHAGGKFLAVGDCQFTKLQLHGSTTDATPTELVLSTRFVLLDEYSYAFTVTIHGRQDTGANHAMYKRMCVLERTAGTVALVGSVQTIGTDIESDATWNVALTADDTNKSLCVTVTGKATTNIRWTALIEAVELGYSD